MIILYISLDLSHLKLSNRLWDETASDAIIMIIQGKPIKYDLRLRR